MKAIWKYPLEMIYKQTLEIPTGFKVRHVGPQRPIDTTRDGICIWVEVDSTAPREPIDFYIVGTGHSFPDDSVGAIYCGTAPMADGYVWHVFLAVP